MRLLFVDECGDKEKPAYLGFCVATVDVRFYPLLKRAAHSILNGIKWDTDIEFKGSYLFSASKGCQNVCVEDRVRAAGELLDLNASNKNSRMRFAYGRLQSANHRDDYLLHLPTLIERSLPSAPKGAGKDLIAITCDERSDISSLELDSALRPVADRKGYVLLERVVRARSSFDTVGLMFADLVGYLVARIDNIQFDSGFLEALTPEEIANNGRLRKLTSSQELIEKVKNISLYRKR